MKRKPIILISALVVCLISCSKQKTIEIPLIQKNGYGPFQPAFGGISTYSEDENNPWKKTYLKVTGVPENWTEIKQGDIETNMHQSIYQNYLLGNITPERYEELQKAWNWQPDTLALSKEPIKTKIAFAVGKDSTGKVKMIVDANNNLDLSDDKAFIPYELEYATNTNVDSLAQNRSINVSYEKYTGNKKLTTSVELFITHMSRIDMYMCNFPQYCIANFKGEEIAVSPGNFTDLLYSNPGIVLLADSLEPNEKINPENIIAKNEFIETKHGLYKNLGVNSNTNSLILEKINSPKHELYSTQVGYKSFNFEGNDFATDSQITSDKLRGKYVLLDFWAVWCGPCRYEIPNLKELYKKTNREKFEIVSIVGDSPTDALRDIIEQDSISWPQILSTDTNKIKEKFSVHGYPTTFLLNPEGIIIAKNIRGKKLEDKVLGLIDE